MTIPSIPLNTGASIPQLGLGTWPLDDAEVADAVEAAAALGYRHIDTATKYGNEAGVADGIRRTGIDRGEFFVTTKLDGAFQGDDRAIGGLDAALDRMGFDYVDLLLIHWPLPKRGLFVDTWRTFERLHADGRARAIGVSNFRPEHLEVLLAETEVVPAVNQIQLNPRVPRPDHRDYDAAHGIVTVSYSPLGGQGARVLDDPVVRRIADGLGRTPAQVVLRWHVQQGLVAIPKSASPERMRDNLAIFDFELTASDLAELATLSQGPDAGVDSNVDGH
ncbi:MAG: aldo/keto reductase [Protaetiibacter sp.]